MTPYKNGISEKKIPYIFKFSIYKAKFTNEQVKEILDQYGFKKFELTTDPNYDFQMKIRLEEYHNSTLFAKKLISKYNDVFMEISSKKFDR